jgi:hypothetical protein
MFHRFIDDFKRETGIALRLSSLALAAAFAFFITTAFLCAAAFVFVLERYGLLYACLSGAAVFFVLTVIAAGSYMIVKKRSERRAAAAAKAAAPSFLSDPAMLAAGLQIVRIVGVKRMVPLVAVAGIALGLLAKRNQQADDPTD